MWKALRLRRTHACFLASCRNLREGRDYWADLARWKRWILETCTPAPLMSLLPEAKPVADAVEWLEQECRSRRLGEEVLKTYHRFLFPSTGGIYRAVAAGIVGSSVRLPSPNRIPVLVRQLDARLAELQRAWDVAPPSWEAVVEEAMDVYLRIGVLHPFPDGNGRVARLALNHLTRRYGQPYVVLPPLNESQALLDALREGNRGNLEPLIRFGRAHARP
jgi:fido (protein-threonine AMPylation protein)